MLLGSRMPGPVTGWRFVEDDLYDIAGRVTEYDPDARLIREDETGALGLCRWIEPSRINRGGWTFVRQIHDLDNDAPLTGEPDGRVMRFMRAADSRRLRDTRKWEDWAQDREWRREAAQDNEFHEQNLEMAQRFLNVAKRDTPARPRAFIPRSV